MMSDNNDNEKINQNEDTLDVNSLMKNIDINSLLKNVDKSSLMKNMDMGSLMKNIDMGSLMNMASNLLKSDSIKSDKKDHGETKKIPILNLINSEEKKNKLLKLNRCQNKLRKSEKMSPRFTNN